jgi:2-dehydropantoate 2-reductase
MKKLLFVGAGGVGGYFGARLIEAGVDVTFLVRPARAAALAAHGLSVSSPHGDLHLPVVRCVTRDTVGADYDLVLLAPKAYDLADVLDSVASAVGPATFVMPLLNGLAHLDILDARFGAHRVFGGVAQVVATLAADGSIRQMDPIHILTAGGRDEATQQAAAAFIALCEPARFNKVLAPDIMGALWSKWTFLATLAGITTLMHGSVGQVVSTAGGDSLIRRLYAECVAVGERCGFAVPETTQAVALKRLTEPGSGLTASMLRDLQSGLRTEHEHVLGELLRRAQQHGVDAPLLAAAYCHLQVAGR